MMLENQALQSKADDKRDRELIRQLRREADENKRRITELLGEVSDVRRERDRLKLEKNEQFVEYTKALEDERNQRRALQSDLDRATFKLKCSEEEYQKALLKVEKKSGEVAQTKLDKANTEGLLRQKDATIE